MYQKLSRCPEARTAQPWPLVSVLSKPAMCEGQDSPRVTVYCTLWSTHQGLRTRGPQGGQGPPGDRSPTEGHREVGAPGTSPPREGGCGGLLGPLSTTSCGRPGRSSQQAVTALLPQDKLPWTVSILRAKGSPQPADFAPLPEQEGSKPKPNLSTASRSIVHLIVAKTFREPDSCASEKTVSRSCLISYGYIFFSGK